MADMKNEMLKTIRGKNEKTDKGDNTGFILLFIDCCLSQHGSGS